MQNEIKSHIELLDESGHITEEGWARKPYWNYDRSKIKAGWHRIKEWDYYYILNSEFGITFTMADLGYIGLAAVAWIDLKSGSFTQRDTMTILPRGKTGLSAHSDNGNALFEDKVLRLSYTIRNNQRVLDFDCPDFRHKGQSHPGLKGTISLHQKQDADSMCIATSWKENRKAFYYNQKINCMPADGTVHLGNEIYRFDEKSSSGGLDWGRGNWTYRNRWYWGSASGRLNGVPFGWNIGYGFSDRSPASENMIFYNHRAHKLTGVTFHFDESDYMKPWKFTSSDGRFEMDFEPAVDRNGRTNLLFIKSVQHQVFGFFSGYVILDDGKKLNVESFPGFAEDVLNWW